MTERRRYTKRQKAALVGRAQIVGVLPAAREAGIPGSTLQYWWESEEFVKLRERKKDEVAADVYAVFQKGVQRVSELIPLTDDMSKVAIATGILYDKFALMSGHATQRTETADVTARLSDHETEALQDILESALESAK